MKKKFMNIILTAVLMISLIGCGETKQESTVNQEIGQDEAVEDMDERPEGTEETVLEKADEESASENAEEKEYIEQRDIFVCKEIDTGDGKEIDLSNKETVAGPFIFTDSVDIYSYYFTYAGYTKPDIEIHSVGKVGDWIFVPFAQSSFLVKAEDFERVAALKDGNKENTGAQEATDNQMAANEIPANETSAENVPAEIIPTEETAPSSDKYTPEEAVAVYRALMEAGGITWNPELKGVTSWGTGWIYLAKGQPEWTAQTNLESFAMGDTGGHSWTEYYLEVTGSDEDAVYITQWHN